MTTLIETQSMSAPTLTTLAKESLTRPLWVQVGRLLDGASTTPVQNAHILFDAKTIHYVGTELPPRHLLAANQSTPDLTLSNHTLLPTLTESHAHLFLDGAPVVFEARDAYLKQSPEWMLDRARARLPKILQSGVGAIRDAGDKQGVGLTLSAERKSAVRDPRSAIPYIDSPGPAIHHKGRYGAFMGSPLEDHLSPAACVAARVAQGADRIKLLVSGIINFKEGQVTTPPQMSIDEVRQLVEAAKAHGKQTFAHASGTPGVEHSIEGGVNTVEHGFFITEDQLVRMRDRQIAWVPTFAPVQLQIDRAKDLGWDDTVVGHLKRIIDAHQKMLARAHDIGVPIIAGSDAGSCGVPHAIGLLDELLHMQHAGLPPIAILNSATGMPSTLLNFPQKFGKIAPGYLPRFILTQHNLLESVANLAKEKSIFFDGHVIDCPDNLIPDGL